VIITSTLPSTQPELNFTPKTVPLHSYTAFEAGEIEAWQVCLREKISAERLLLKYPGIALNAPLCAPTWAGGKNHYPEKNLRIWTWDELDEIKTGLENKTLLPFEAAIKFSQKGKRIARLIEQMECELPTCPMWTATWAQCGELDTTAAVQYEEGELLNAKTTGVWTAKEEENLGFYWAAEILTPQEVASFLERTLEDTLAKAQSLGLPPKTATHKEWCGISWDFQFEGAGDPKLLDSATQHDVAQAAATRFALLYETLDLLPNNSKNYKKAENEINKIVTLQIRIFSKYTTNQAKRFNYQGMGTIQAQYELEQNSRTALFDCMRRWHPNRGIRFSRKTVTDIINREMLVWADQQRLISLPEKLKSVAKRLRTAKNTGNYEEEYKTLEKEVGPAFTKEADKHKDNYGYIASVAITELYKEDDAENSVGAYHANCEGDFTTYTESQENTDLRPLILSIADKLKAPEKHAILGYYGISESEETSSPKTLEILGKEANVTKERIRQRLVKAHRKMRFWLESQNIRKTNSVMAF
jgi:DNA-directed RNA polymerase sigma subunit (sigma70/sigma32)